MQERTRNTILIGLCFLFIVLLGVWWYFGFSLDFMRFFAAEPGVLNPKPPEGCFYQDVQCIQAPCSPVLVCPSCQPRPACLDATPSCDMAEPADGWCPPNKPGIGICSPASQTVRVGQPASLSGMGGNGRYEWFSPDGSPSSGATTVAPEGNRQPSYTVTYATAGTKKVTMQSGDATQGSPNVNSVACTVIVTP